MNRIGPFTDMVRLQRCFEMVCMPKLPATLTDIACITMLLLQASRKTDIPSRLFSPLADDCRRFFALKYAKLLNNHCVLLGIIVCTTITGISSFHSCDLHHSACTISAQNMSKAPLFKAVRVILYRLMAIAQANLCTNLETF